MSPHAERDLINELLDIIIDELREMQSRGENISEDIQNRIADEIEASIRRLEELDNEIQAVEYERSQQAMAGAPVSADAQLLWTLAGGNQNAFINYLRQFPSESTQNLLNNPLEFSRVVTILNHTMPQGALPVQDGIEKAPLQSSNIWGARYDPHHQKLIVRFQGGSVYEYGGVPNIIWNAFIHGNAPAKTSGQNQYGRWWVGKNPSLGAALNFYIKAAGFPYRRIR